jgi:hypothetical protein
MAICKCHPHHHRSHHHIVRSILSARSYTNGVDNPFARRETHGRYALSTYRVLVPITWLLVVIFGVYYTLHSPDDVKHGRKIFKQGHVYTTPFSLNTTITEIYWYACPEQSNFVLFFKLTALHCQGFFCSLPS